MEPHGFLVVRLPVIVWKKNSLFTGFLQVFKKFVKHVPEPAFLLSVINFPKRKLSSDPKFRKWKKKRLVKVKLEKKVIWYNHNNRIETCPSLRKDFFTKIPRRYCFHVRMCCNVALKLQNQTCFYWHRWPNNQSTMRKILRGSLNNKWTSTNWPRPLKSFQVIENAHSER